MAIDTGNYKVRALTFCLTEQIGAHISLRVRDVPMAGLNLVMPRIAILAGSSVGCSAKYKAQLAVIIRCRGKREASEH